MNGQVQTTTHTHDWQDCAGLAGALHDIANLKSAQSEVKEWMKSVRALLLGLLCSVIVSLIGIVATLVVVIAKG